MNGLPDIAATLGGLLGGLADAAGRFLQHGAEAIGSLLRDGLAGPSAAGLLALGLLAVGAIAALAFVLRR